VPPSSAAISSVGTVPAATASASSPSRPSVAVACARRSLTSRRPSRAEIRPGAPRRGRGSSARPPLDRVDVHAVDHDAEVQVIAGREPGVAGLSDRIAAPPARPARRSSRSGGRRAKRPRPWSMMTVVP
jgi:hypothetical protein